MAPTNHPDQPHDTKQFFGEEKSHQQKATSDTPITDETILAKSHQIIQNDDALQDDKIATGIALPDMGVVLKQWFLTLQWHRTRIPKKGLYHTLKKNTEWADLDLSCLLCNRYGEVIERVWYKNVRDQAESIRHQGDEFLGKKPIDPSKIPNQADVSESTPRLDNPDDPKTNQESLIIYLNKIPQPIFHVVLLVSCYQGFSLNKVQNAQCQLSDDEGNLISELNFAKLPSTTKALWFASLTRTADNWHYNTEHQPLTTHDLNAIEKEIGNKLVRTAR